MALSHNIQVTGEYFKRVSNCEWYFQWQNSQLISFKNPGPTLVFTHADCRSCNSISKPHDNYYSVNSCEVTPKLSDWDIYFEAFVKNYKEQYKSKIYDIT